MDHRIFWLENGNGEKYDLTDILNAVFATDPSGLGAQAKLTSTKLNNSRTADYIDWELIPVKFNINFRYGDTNATTYEEYKKFFEFCSKYPTYLHMQTPAMSDTSVFREIVLTQVDKTEIENDGTVLVCPVLMEPLTLWFGSDENIIDIDATRGLGKRYELKREYFYATGSLDNVQLISDSNVEIPLIIEIEGACENPTYAIFDENGTAYGIGRFVGQFHYVFVDANDLSETIELRRGEAYLPNPTAYQDATVGIPNQTYLTFITLKPGRSIMTFSFANTFTGTVKIRWRNNYVTV